MRAREDPTWRATRLEQLGIEDSEDLDIDTVLPLPPPGLPIPVQLGQLIEAVYVAPNAAPWFPELVEAVMRRYERSEPVRQSSLGIDPVY